MYRIRLWGDAYTDASNPNASRCLANQSMSGTWSQNLTPWGCVGRGGGGGGELSRFGLGAQGQWGTGSTYQRRRQQELRIKEHAVLRLPR
jgi:hypothetical protein